MDHLQTQSISLPRLGLGTYRMQGDACRAAVESALAPVALKWLLDQDNVAAIPKASRKESQQANLDALKVKLDDDRKAIARLPKDKRFVSPGFGPAWD
jgi:diketogulonate reductase-like aldo/keto reductase